MVSLVLFTGIILCLVFGVPSMLLVIWQLGFKHRILIAKQTGESLDDVVWMDDKARITFLDGNYQLVFKRQKGKLPVPAGAWWHKFFKNKTAKFDEKDWLEKDMTSKLKRGLVLYENNVGEFHPVQFKTENGQAHLEILSQENRLFLSHEVMQTQKITLTKRQQVMALTAIVVGFVLLGFMFMFATIYLSNQFEMVAGVAGKLANPAVVQGVVGG